MAKEKIALGRSGEEIAGEFLAKEGYRVLFKNYKTRLGEIDIVAKDSGTLCFIEVKTRTSDRFGLPKEAVNFYKRRKLASLALSFLKENNLTDARVRFDVVGILADPGGAAQIELVKGAFEAEGV